MNKAQLKKLIKPVVKECIQEVLIEEGLLTEVVAQVASGMSRQPSTPGEAHKQSILGDNPNDAGVDISSIMGNAGKIWQALK